MSQTALPCWTLIKASGLLEATAGAPLPVNDTGGEIGAFGDRQTGQLDSANADKAGIKRMGDLCERLNAEALEKSRRRAKPWWKRVF
ncbi:MAG: hypothetical protein KDJ43_12220 [Rhizobiaceae bacterium]|nr:hypothetical protein [Rhizobiaceae bacterium]